MNSYSTSGWSQDTFCQYNMIGVMKEDSEVKE